MEINYLKNRKFQLQNFPCCNKKLTEFQHEIQKPLARSYYEFTGIVSKPELGILKSFDDYLEIIL